jgi:hypothetical protein
MAPKNEFNEKHCQKCQCEHVPLPTACPLNCGDCGKKLDANGVCNNKRCYNDFAG